jgi:hypothetical protein
MNYSTVFHVILQESQTGDESKRPIVVWPGNLQANTRGQQGGLFLVPLDLVLLDINQLSLKTHSKSGQKVPCFCSFEVKAYLAV